LRKAARISREVFSVTGEGGIKVRLIAGPDGMGKGLVWLAAGESDAEPFAAVTSQKAAAEKNRKGGNVGLQGMSLYTRSALQVKQ
jgi:hypothetical protein